MINLIKRGVAAVASVPQNIRDIEMLIADTNCTARKTVQSMQVNGFVLDNLKPARADGCTKVMEKAIIR